MLTVLELQRFIRHTLGGAEPPSEIPAIAIINEAGEELVNARRWNWLVRPETPLSLTASQNYISLPADFGEVISLEMADTLNGQMIAVTPKEIMAWRSTPVPAAPTTFYWTIEYQGTSAAGAPVPRIALHTDPTTSQANAIRLIYRAGWTPLSADGDAAVIPTWMESLYRDFITAVARGRCEEDIATVGDRLEVVLNSSSFRAKAARDAATQVNRGQLAGGAVRTIPRPMLFNPDTTVGTPVQY